MSSKLGAYDDFRWGGEFEPQDELKAVFDAAQQQLLVVPPDSRFQTQTHRFSSFAFVFCLASFDNEAGFYNICPDRLEPQQFKLLQCLNSSTSGCS